MTRLVVAFAVFSLAAPALADRGEAVALTDAQLEAVAGGTQSVALPTTNLNLNVSPITVTQTAVAVNTQTATLNGFPGNGKAKGLQKHGGFQGAWQNGFAAASNYVKINYHVNQHN